MLQNPKDDDFNNQDHYSGMENTGQVEYVIKHVINFLCDNRDEFGE